MSEIGIVYFIWFHKGFYHVDGNAVVQGRKDVLQMIDTVIHGSVPIVQASTNFTIKYNKRDEACDRLVSRLAKTGWVFNKSPAGDIVSVQLVKDKITYDDVKMFDKLAQYVHHNSSIELKPEPFRKTTPSIWWFFENGSLREAHWGVDL